MKTTTATRMGKTKEKLRARLPLAKAEDALPYCSALGRAATLEEIYEAPLLLDAKRYWTWACKRFGKPFMKWVRENWITATEREIQVMHRAWIAAGGAAS